MKEKILKLRNEGYSYNKIVGELGCAKSTVSYYCKGDKFIKTTEHVSKDEMVNFIKEGYSYKMLADKFNVKISCIRYWLKKYDIKTKSIKYEKYEIKDGKRRCKKCNEIKEINDFYNRGKGRENERYLDCKKCRNEYFTQKGIDTKIKMVDYKGGECVRCKLSLKNSNYTIFDFHHRDPLDKDIDFNRIKNKKWKTIKKEIDKCDLVCSNCHRTIHYELYLEKVRGISSVG